MPFSLRSPLCFINNVLAFHIVLSDALQLIRVKITLVLFTYNHLTHSSPILNEQCYAVSTLTFVQKSA